MKETKLQRVIRRTEQGDFKNKGILRVSFNGFSAIQFFENEKGLEKAIKNLNAKNILEMLKNLQNK